VEEKTMTDMTDDLTAIEGALAEIDAWRRSPASPHPSSLLAKKIFTSGCEKVIRRLVAEVERLVSLTDAQREINRKVEAGVDRHPAFVEAFKVQRELWPERVSAEEAMFALLLAYAKLPPRERDVLQAAEAALDDRPRAFVKAFTAWREAMLYRKQTWSSWNATWRHRLGAEDAAREAWGAVLDAYEKLEHVS
jgi:hypothetical protein